MTRIGEGAALAKLPFSVRYNPDAAFPWCVLFFNETWWVGADMAQAREAYLSMRLLILGGLLAAVKADYELSL